MTYQPRNKKAPWFIAIHGDKPAPKPRNPGAKRGQRRRKPVRSVSKLQAKRLAAYHRRVRVWKRDKVCSAGGIYFIAGKAIRFCSAALPHKCDDCHHAKGKAGDLLMDERYWIPVCREAHTNVREHPIEARAAGFYIGAWNTVQRDR